MEDLSLHILDIVENSIRAKATRVKIRVIEDRKKDLLTIEIEDNGQGMNEPALRRVFDPFFTTKSGKRVGLGLPLLSHAAQESGGNVEIKSKVGQGTRVKATFGYSHIDRRPFGDIEKTLTTLVAGNPEIRFIYEHKRDRASYRLDTEEIKADVSRDTESSRMRERNND